MFDTKIIVSVVVAGLIVAVVSPMVAGLLSKSDNFEVQD